MNGEAAETDLVTGVRSGHDAAFAILYANHVAAARQAARQFAHHPTDVDDLVAEAFTRVLAALRSGQGPRTAFRGYLLTTLRNYAYETFRHARRFEAVGDLTDLDDALGMSLPDTAVVIADRCLTAQLFAGLPERWRTVLWHTECEGRSPQQAAAMLGLTPTAVSALAFRARRGLRQQYRR